MKMEYKVGDKVIWTGRGGWGAPALWRVETIINVTPAGKARTSEDGPLYGPGGWAIGDKWGRGGSIEPWTAEREATLRTNDAKYASAKEFRKICEALAGIRDIDLASKLLPLVSQEFLAAIAKAEGRDNAPHDQD